MKSARKEKRVWGASHVTFACNKDRTTVQNWQYLSQKHKTICSEFMVYTLYEKVLEQ